MPNDAIVVEMKEEFSLDDRVADGSAEVVIAKKFSRISTEVIVERIQGVILKILISCTMKAICTSLANLVV